MQIYKNVSNEVSMVYERDGLVYPLTLPRGMFSTVQVDNINKQCSSTTAKTDFIGMSMSMACHPDENNPWECIPLLPITENRKEFRPLHKSYTCIKPTYLVNASPHVPKADCENVQPLLTSVQEDAERKEYIWLEHMNQIFEKSDQTPTKVGWAAFHTTCLVLCKSDMLPL